MEYRVARVDTSRGANPIKWSTESAVALALHSGIVILEPDAAVLALEKRIVWRRYDLTAANGPGCAVTDLAWSSPSVQTIRQSILAALTSAGDIVVVWSPANKVWTLATQRLDGLDAHCLTWISPTRLAVGVQDGVSFFDLNLDSAEPQLIEHSTKPVPGLVVDLVVGTGLQAVLGNNSVIDVFSGVVSIPSGRQLLYSVVHSDRGLVVARPGSVSAGTKQIELEDMGLSFVVRLGGTVQVVSSRGVSTVVHGNLPPLQFGKGRIWGLDVHPTQPLAIALVGPTSIPGEWEAPIVSTMSVSLSVRSFGSPCVPRAADATAAWFAAITSNLPLESPADVQPYGIHETLEERLREVVRGPGFDRLRAEWWTEGPDKSKQKDVLQRCRSLIYDVLRTLEPSLPIEKAVMLSYAAVVNGAANGEIIPLRLAGELTENFNFAAADNAEQIESQEGHIWRRCAVTLLPLLSLKTVESSDGSFAALSSSAQYNDSPVIGALLSAFDFCVFNGTKWQARS